MTNTELNILIQEFIEDQPNDDKDEWYVTSKGAAKIVMRAFIEFLAKKQIKNE